MGDHGCKANSPRGGQGEGSMCTQTSGGGGDVRERSDGSGVCQEKRRLSLGAREAEGRRAQRGKKRHLAVEVQEREDKRCSEKQGKGRRLSSTGVREQRYSAVMGLFVYKLSMYSRGGISGLIRSMQKQPAPGLST